MPLVGIAGSCRSTGGSSIVAAAAALDVVHKLDLVGTENLVALALLALLGLRLLGLLAFIVTLIISLLLALITLFNRRNFTNIVTIPDLLMSYSLGLASSLGVALCTRRLYLDVLLILTTVTWLLLLLVDIINCSVPWSLI